MSCYQCGLHHGRHEHWCNNTLDAIENARTKLFEALHELTRTWTFRCHESTVCAAELRAVMREAVER